MVLAFYEFGVRIECYFVAKHSGREAGGDAEIGTFDRAGDFEAGDGLFALRINGRAIEGGIEGDGFRYAMEGQIARDLEVLVVDLFEGRAFERQGAVLSGVKEIRAFEVCVALFVAGVEAVDVGAEFDGRIGEIVFRRGEGGASGAKGAGDGINAHMGDTKKYLGVGFVHAPGLSENGGRGEQ